MNEIEREGFLAHAQLPVFRRRVERAIACIQEAIALGDAYVAVSWGKDSLVLLHLCQRVNPAIACVHFGAEDQDRFDDYSRVCREYGDRFGLPSYAALYGQQNAQDGLKKHGLTERNVFLGLRSEEGRWRKRSRIKHGLIHTYADSKRWRACPIFDWTWQDVWAYIVAHDLPYLSSYDHFTKEDRSRSRTSVHIGRGRGAGSGRMAQLKAIAPEYFADLKDLYPDLTTHA